jgi:histidinol-phosphate aminotransferase
MKNKIEIRNDLKNWKKYMSVPSAESIAIGQNKEIENIDKLDANESVYGPSPLVAKELAMFKGYQYYPDPEYKALRKEISTYTNVDIDSIFVSNGGDEIIDLLLRLMLNVGDEVIDCPPTFSSYSLSTVLNRGVVKVLKRKVDFSLDINSILKSINRRTKVIFVCNPNNPTGNITPLYEIQKILERGVLVCVDEAYIEFGGESSVSLLSRYENLVVIRSLSKWAGIAGLRLGYGLMSKYLVNQLMKIKPPYNVNYAAVIAGIASIQDREYREATIKKVIRKREKLEREILKMKSYKVLQSGGNFISIQTTRDQLISIKDDCMKKGLSLRYYISGIMGNVIRITVGTASQNRKVIIILKKYI